MSEVDEVEHNEFGKAEERAIISLIFDKPEFVSTILPQLDDTYFDAYETKYVFSLVKHYYDKKQVIVSRQMAIDIAERELEVTDPYKEVIELIKRESDPREVPIIMDKLVEWARRKTLSKIYSEEVINAHENGDYSAVEKIIEDARRITEFNSNFYFFFDQIENLFIQENEQKLTTGFSRLDTYINQGGPIRGDAFCWMAPTGVGKSIALVNSGAANLLQGRNVLHITLEMSKEKTAQRYMGCFTNEWIRARFNPAVQERIRARLDAIKKSYSDKIVIVEYPPNDISVDVIHANCDVLRRVHGFNPDVIIVDYLELLMPRQINTSDKDYNSQKRVSTELCRLAKKEQALVFSALQTNRDGNDNLNTSAGTGPNGGTGGHVIELNKVAESYGKTMPVDYLVTINQNKQEYEEGLETPMEIAARAKNKEVEMLEAAITKARCRFYIAKNRNGPKFKSVSGFINYETMKMQEYDG